ncbi:hypothetical protein B0T25DRAFT_173842 [Lasiosphaeria hispida]|uniref:Uncharacterized protein n=1 Tax=Lasiosphaeria hispida TaxID=260671 RepID=A0AAJ0HN09_9PEZI|nr:hypothetical protein B0T25DRAFT_173842 [Lasiosphaeria hispida]
MLTFWCFTAFATFTDGLWQQIMARWRLKAEGNGDWGIGGAAAFGLGLQPLTGLAGVIGRCPFTVGSWLLARTAYKASGSHIQEGGPLELPGYGSKQKVSPRFPAMGMGESRRSEKIGGSGVLSGRHRHICIWNNIAQK